MVWTKDGENMNTKLKYKGLLLVLLGSLALPVAADEGWLDGLFARKNGVAAVKNALYQEECGSCHFPYQPGWLPERSWQRLLSSKALEDHFGENAELDESDRQAILDYVLANAAEHSGYKRSKKIMHSLRDGETPLRITETRYIRRKHHEIPRRLIEDNPKVGSLSNCDSCHTEAARGNFDEDTVRIPGYGYWDD